jgi:hypothetical protein
MGPGRPACDPEAGEICGRLSLSVLLCLVPCSRSSLPHPQAKFVYSTKHTFQMDATTFITIRSQAVSRLQANVKSRAEELYQTLQETSTRLYLAAVVLYFPDLASESGLGAALSHESSLASLLEAARLCTAALVSTAGEVLMGPPPSAPQQSSSAHQPASSIASPIQQPRGQGGSALSCRTTVCSRLPA